MQRVGFTLRVKEDLIDEYKGRHQVVWPELLEALSRSGWHNYSLFMRGDGTLFGYVEVPESFQDALDAMDLEVVNVRWQADMSRFFEGTGLHADQMMEELELVFHLD